MQFQSDVLGVKVTRPVNRETTAAGAAYLSGLATGFWPSISALESVWAQDAVFSPSMPDETRKNAMKAWKRAVERSRNWIE
jgi:glycerol kinase